MNRKLLGLMFVGMVLNFSLIKAKAGMDGEVLDEKTQALAESIILPQLRLHDKSVAEILKTVNSDIAKLGHGSKIKVYYNPKDLSKEKAVFLLNKPLNTEGFGTRPLVNVKLDEACIFICKFTWLKRRITKFGIELSPMENAGKYIDQYHLP